MWRRPPICWAVPGSMFRRLNAARIGHTQQPVLIALAKSGQEPTPLHNNCSGKHAGFLCTCRHLGIETRGYSALGSPEQDMVRDAMESVTGAAHTLDHCGTDGCSIPTYAIPLRNLAHGFARMATGAGLEPVRAAAARRSSMPRWQRHTMSLVPIAPVRY